MQILDTKQINQKIKRLSFEIMENHYAEKEIYLAGINNNGFDFAKLLKSQLGKISEIDFKLCRLNINPAQPTQHDISLSIDENDLKNKVIIVIDDVANTGRTIFYAFKPLLNVIPKKIEVAVLVDRKHKSYPVEVNYMGLSLATTLKENIRVSIQKASERAVYLED